MGGIWLVGFLWTRSEFRRIVIRRRRPKVYGPRSAPIVSHSRSEIRLEIMSWDETCGTMLIRERKRERERKRGRERERGRERGGEREKPICNSNKIQRKFFASKGVSIGGQFDKIDRPSYRPQLRTAYLFKSTSQSSKFSSIIQERRDYLNGTGFSVHCTDLVNSFGLVYHEHLPQLKIILHVISKSVS